MGHISPSHLPGFGTNISVGMGHMGLIHHAFHPELKAAWHIAHKVLKHPRPTCKFKQHYASATVEGDWSGVSLRQPNLSTLVEPIES